MFLKYLKSKKRNSFKEKIFFKKRSKINLNKFKDLITFKISKKNIKLMIILFFLAIFSGLLIFFSTTFTIKNIDIIKNDDLINIDLSYNSVEDFRGKNILLTNKEEIIKNLKNYQKNIKNVNIDITLPDKIKIYLTSYKAVFNTSIADNNYILTSNGVAIPKNKFDPKLKNIELKFKENPNLNIINYQNILDEKYINKIVDIQQEIEENLLGIKVDEIKYYVLEREIMLKINNQTILIIELNGDTNKEVEKLAIFNKENFNLKNDGIYYIDLRIKDKIFYCEKSEIKKCANNLSSIYY